MRNYHFYMHKTYEISDCELGTIAIRHSKRARRISFRGENGSITAIVPFHFAGNLEYLHSLIDRHRKALKKLLERSTNRQSDSLLYDGKKIEIVEGSLLITTDCNVGRRNIHTKKIDTGIIFTCHPDDITQPAFQQGFARHIMRTLTNLYGVHLRQMVTTLAALWGVNVKAVRIGRGQHVLGHCSRAGTITISAFVLLLPQHLREYIIYHELAHRTHFDHSPAFHTLCNVYCNGNEAVWAKELRKSTFPISL